MAWRNMLVAPTQEGGDAHLKAFEFEDSLAAASNGNSIIVPDDIQNVSIVVKPAGGATAKFQFTCDSVSEVKAGTAEWLDSDDGLVAVDTSDVIFPCTAVRLVQVGVGTSIVKVRAQ